MSVKVDHLGQVDRKREHWEQHVLDVYLKETELVALCIAEPSRVRPKEIKESGAIVSKLKAEPEIDLTMKLSVLKFNRSISRR